jgi:NAD(P)-dependent dehydrogenase (short-subunit alcohol dehydrogenase family)
VSIAIVDTDIAAAQALAREIEADGGRARAWSLDVSDHATVAAAVEIVDEQLGAPTILVNAAEIGDNCSFLELSDDVWQRCLDVNLYGMVTACQASIPYMRSAGWGRIVNITSAGVHRGRPGRAAYIASKSAVIGLTTSLALEFAGAGITVNAISIGMVDRDALRAGAASGAFDLDREIALTPVGRLGQPDDVAAVCAFLVGSEASYITGQLIGVNGGRET